MICSLSLLSLLSILPLGLTQTSDVICLPYYDWMANSQNKTPCEVASSLLAPCNDGTFDVLPLSEGQHYQGPTTVANAKPCMCNTVTYSLMTACGLCQGRATMRWSEWSTNCPSVTLSRFPNVLPPDVRVPAWAYNDVKTGDMFDQFLARDTSNATESSALPISSTTPISSPSPTADGASLSTTSSISPAVLQDSSDESSESEAMKHANLVGGSVIGSLFGVMIIIGVVVFWMKRRGAAVNSSSESHSLEKGSEDP